MLLQVLVEASLLLAALAVSYALLKRRVLDFKFVLSRTLVVATVSLIVVAAFVLLEYVLGSALSDVSRTTGVVANVLLALFLGVSMRYIHKRVDVVIDSLLFRKRNEDERALREFSHEAAYVTEREALLDRAIDAVRRHTDARGAALMLDGNGTYSTVRAFGTGAQSAVDENDAALLALRAWHKPIDPHHYATAINGALALPMLARGRLAGVLTLGERAGGEAYAPDEVEALAQLAHGVGTALETLSTANGEADSVPLLKAIALQQAEIVAELRAVHDALTARNQLGVAELPDS
ncbi:MAG TPA: GAF domain-containing protein [Candidatus Acidoferrales bacterium]|nr:GAF domain-containing protein [Candidatus Acidoferrales bacterium]